MSSPRTLSVVFDSHCHLTDIDGATEVLQGALGHRVGMLCCGYNAQSCSELAVLRAAEPRLRVGYGLHPWFALEPLEPVLEHFERPEAAAVGEIGLDLWRNAELPPLERQLGVLEVQLSLAQSLDLPVSLHSRHAVDAIIAVLRRFSQVRGVLHAFTGSVEQAKTLVRMGYLIGIGGTVTKPQARRVRRLVEQLPLASLLLETDCPAMGMDGRRREDVRPWDVIKVAAAIAEIKGVPLVDVEATTDENARRMFGAHFGQKMP